jgi:hypothetical protein
MARDERDRNAGLEAEQGTAAGGAVRSARPGGEPTLEPERAPEAERADDDTHDDLDGEVAESLYDEDEARQVAGLPFGDAVSRIRADLNLRPDWLPQDGRAREGAGDAAPANDSLEAPGARPHDRPATPFARTKAAPSAAVKPPAGQPFLATGPP